ncbi:MAG: glycosyltransferase [Dechloromonas sp.]|nr:glycosyltransferase [Dechloromonas sp.]
MKISLLDPGLKSVVGHHFDLDLRLARVLAQRGHEVSVHGSRDLAPTLVAKAAEVGMELHASFSIPTYRRLPAEKKAANGLRGLLRRPQAQPSAIDIYRSWARQTAEELAVIPEADLWFWPTLASYQFDAATLPQRGIRQAGGLWWQPRFPVEIGARSWQQTARRAAGAAPQFVVGAYDEAIARAYRSFSPQLEMHRLPCPHDGAVNLRQPAELKRIGFFGHQRLDRGIDLVPGLVNALLDRGFEIVLQDSSQTLRGKVDDPRLEILPFIDDFPALVARCDAVIWPSRWEAYQQNCSGVVSECIATGVPVILPAGCLPAEVAARFNCGIFFCDYSSEAILEAVDALTAGFATAWAAAQAARQAWRAENGTERLACWLEHLIEGKA